MSTKRLLFIQDDPLVGSFFRDQLETAGFAVETVRNGEAGLRAMDELQPDLVVLDPVLPSADIGESIHRIRTRAGGMPIFVLPTEHPALVHSAQQAGATRLLSRAANPVAELLDAASSALGVGKPSAGGASDPWQLDEHWQQATLSALPGSLLAMRHALHDLTREPADTSLLRALLQRVHGFAEQTGLLGDSVLGRLATALEVLVFGLSQFPERLNASAMRTLGQCIDFLGVLLERDAHALAPDLSRTQIVIVEDEASARDLIVAAMRLVGLNADGLDTPGASLALLSTQPCDLIFLDVNLPEMNGFELCTHIRALPLHERTPVLFLTGMTSFQNRVQSSLSGGNDFVGKPFNLAELGVKALIWVFKGQLGVN